MYVYHYERNNIWKYIDLLEFKKIWLEKHGKWKIKWILFLFVGYLPAFPKHLVALVRSQWVCKFGNVFSTIVEFPETRWSLQYARRYKRLILVTVNQPNGPRGDVDMRVLHSDARTRGPDRPIRKSRRTPTHSGIFSWKPGQNINFN